MLHKIYRKSKLTGNINNMELPLSNFQIDISQCKTDDDLRSEFQFLNFSERQFLLTGITLEEDVYNRKLNKQNKLENK